MLEGRTSQFPATQHFSRCAAVLVQRSLKQLELHDASNSRLWGFPKCNGGGRVVDICTKPARTNLPYKS
jgi:hypothetical protein